MRKPAKAVQKKAIAMIEGCFLGLGAERVKKDPELDSTERDYFTLNTKVGSMLLIAADYEFIHCRFNDVQAAKAVLFTNPHSRLNPHSGKWNWHFYVASIEETLAQFGREVRPILE